MVEISQSIYNGILHELTTEEECHSFIDMLDFISEKISYFDAHKNKKTFEIIVSEIIKNQWWSAVSLIFIDAKWCQKAYIRCKDYVPKNKLWCFFIDIYIKNGFDFPKHLIDEAIPYRPADFQLELPSEYKNMDCITVYRASCTPPLILFDKLVNEGDIKNETSWTISPTIALGFYQMRIDFKQKCYLYRATIHKDKIIAYISHHCQEEVLQRNSVTNIEPINLYRFHNLCKLEQEYGAVAAQIIDKVEYKMGIRYNLITGKKYNIREQ